MEPRKFPVVERKNGANGVNEFIRMEVKIWRGPKGQITLHSDAHGVIAHIPKKYAIHGQLSRLF